MDKRFANISLYVDRERGRPTDFDNPVVSASESVAFVFPRVDVQTEIISRLPFHKATCRARIRQCQQLFRARSGVKKHIGAVADGVDFVYPIGSRSEHGESVCMSLCVIATDALR